MSMLHRSVGPWQITFPELPSRIASCESEPLVKDWLRQLRVDSPKKLICEYM